MIPALLALFGCYSLPEPPAIDTEPRQVQATLVAEHPLPGAHYPTDLLPLDGGLVVADGYNHRLMFLDGAGALQRSVEDADAFGRATRLSASPRGGIWLAASDGALLRVDGDGLVLERVIPARRDGAEPWEPLDVLEDGAQLVLADRAGRLAWVERDTGAVSRLRAADVEGQPLGAITDLLPASDGGGIWAVDANAGALHRFDDRGEPAERLGQYGFRTGSLSKPKAAALAPGGALLVADSHQAVVQVFGARGQPLGVLTTVEGPLALEHPVAVRSDGERIWVLDAAAPRILELSLSASVVAAAQESARGRALRQPMGEAGEAGEARTCLQCHDGLLQDGRKNWDPARAHHPVDVVPEEAVPEFFPLDDQGRIVCSTCHSPHGSSSPEAAAAVHSGGDRAQVARAQTGEDEFFTRMSRGDDALCEACHGDAVHEDAAAVLAAEGTGHPAGEVLRSALARLEKPLAGSGCLDCHAVHAAVDEETLLREGGDGQLCAACHQESADPARNHPTGPKVRGEGSAAVSFGLDGADGLSCMDCHALAGGHGSALLAKPVDTGLLCGACHSQRGALFTGAHRAVEGRAGTPCLSCHDLHGGDRAGHLLLTLASASAGDPQGCASCHQSAAGGHPVDGLLHDGLDAPLTCASCHDPHNPTAALDACEGCHQAQHEASDRGGHDGVTCLECHPAHADPPLAAAPVNPRSKACLACHAEGSSSGGSWVVAWDHPAPVFDLEDKRWQPLAGLPLFDAAGAERPPGKNGEMTCSTCHLTHGPDPAQPGDSLRRPQWRAVCASCHGDEALLLYRYFHQPERWRKR